MGGPPAVTLIEGPEPTTEATEEVAAVHDQLATLREENADLRARVGQIEDALSSFGSMSRVVGAEFDRLNSQ
jgi:hypothetical protein